MNKIKVVRCGWAEGDRLYEQYHDEEWGVPVHDDRTLFEFLVLEGAQAGLSWITILKRREGYRRVFHEFDVERVAAMTEADIEKALQDDGIIRNKLKVRSAVKNAQVFMQIQKEQGSFAKYLWSFVNGRPIQNRWETVNDVPARSELSDLISKDLKPEGYARVIVDMGKDLRTLSFTADNGIENRHHQKITKKTGATVFFTDPYSSWQKGSVENANKMLRRYFPKGTDFSTISQADVDEALARINNKPRKILGYKSSLQVAYEKGVFV